MLIVQSRLATLPPAAIFRLSSAAEGDAFAVPGLVQAQRAGLPDVPAEAAAAAV
jgi:hypothetical protein